ncbi:MAG: hypothetical protein AAFN27_16580 [Pseudomonadota bacterium]
MSFTSGTSKSATLESHKRVRYSEGLVLGVDEFEQEEYYFLETERRHVRGLHGYGTVCGLDVSVQDAGDAGPEIVVDPGYAMDTNGRTVCVDVAQCARLNEWLGRFEAEDDGPTLPEPPGPVELWVQLCYRECETDLVPIPGGPCRTPEDSMTASRITESFALSFALTRPDQTECDAIRQFGDLIRQIDVVPAGAPDLTIEELTTLIQALAPGAVEPPPPAPPDPIRVPEAEIEAYLEAAFLTWVTFVRPRLLPTGRHCADGPGGDGCIPLARLSFPIAASGAGPIVDGAMDIVTVDEDNRPYLVQTKLLQELLLGSGSTSETGTEAHGDLSGLDQDDHLQYLRIEGRADGEPADRLIRDIDADDRRIGGLPFNGADRDAMAIGQPALGDLSGPYPNPTVVRIHSLDVPNPTPAQVGRFLGVGAGPSWQLLAAPSGGGGGDFGETDLVRIFGLSWRHNLPSDFRFNLDGEEVIGVAVAFGREEFGDGSTALIGVRRDLDLPILDLGSLDACSFRVFVDIQTPNVPGATQRLQITPVDLVPIEPGDQIAEGLFREGREIGREPVPIPAPAALLRFDDRFLRILENNETGVNKVEIEIDGNLVLEGERDPEEARAIDAEFVRAQLPTGDRPRDAERGIQGGVFRSWVNLRRDLDIDAGGGVLINVASRDDMTGAGISPRAADAIIAARDSGAVISRPADLRGITGVGPATIATLSNSDRIRFPGQ